MPGADRIEALRKREAEIRAKIAVEESKRRKRDEKDRERVRLLVGGALLVDAEKNPEARAVVLAVL
jgi:hypothetical protein